MTSLGRFAAGLVSETLPRCLLCALLVAGVGIVGAEDLRTGAGLDSDALLGERIERRLAWDRELAPFRLAVRVNEAVVTVVGTVSTIAESHRARRIANEVTGVLGVVNGITIDPALVPFAGKLIAQPDDRTLAQRIAASLAADDRVAAAATEIRVEDGHVTLAGQVSDVAQSETAERIVRSLYGVQSLSNEIQWP